MTPEDVATLSTDASGLFAAIVGQLMDANLHKLHEVLFPILLDIPYDLAEGEKTMSASSPTIPTTTRTTALALCDLHERRPTTTPFPKTPTTSSAPRQRPRGRLCCRRAPLWSCRVRNQMVHPRQSRRHVIARTKKTPAPTTPKCTPRL